MKKWFVLLLSALMLTGCGAGPQWETVSDNLDQPAAAGEPAQVSYELPEEAVLAASTADELQKYYLGPNDSYEILEQCFAAESLNEATKTVSGFDADRIGLVETTQDDYKRYDLSWTCAGETQQVCRGTILYDGNYYYSLTFACAEDSAQEHLTAGEEMLKTFELTQG